MSLLDVNLNDQQQLKILPDNAEVKVRIARADITPNKNDPSRSNLALVFDVPEDPLVDDIRVWVPIPAQTVRRDDPKRYTKQVNRMAEFCGAFGVQMPVDTEELIGREGWAILREEPNQDGAMQNSVRRFLVRR